MIIIVLLRGSFIVAFHWYYLPKTPKRVVLCFVLITYRSLLSFCFSSVIASVIVFRSSVTLINISVIIILRIIHRWVSSIQPTNHPAIHSTIHPSIHLSYSVFCLLSIVLFYLLLLFRFCLFQHSDQLRPMMLSDLIEDRNDKIRKYVNYKSYKSCTA